MQINSRLTNIIIIILLLIIIIIIIIKIIIINVLIDSACFTAWGKEFQISVPE